MKRPSSASRAYTMVSAIVVPTESCATALTRVFWKSVGWRRSTRQPSRSSAMKARTAPATGGPRTRAAAGIVNPMISSALIR